jgi:hypothetical protein
MTRCDLETGCRDGIDGPGAQATLLSASEEHRGEHRAPAPHECTDRLGPSNLVSCHASRIREFGDISSSSESLDSIDVETRTGLVSYRTHLLERLNHSRLLVYCLDSDEAHVAG